MSIPKNREDLKRYCLKKLGDPVTDVNIAYEQLDDCIDDALQFWREYHYNGKERTYMLHKVTEEDIENGFIKLPPEVSDVIEVHDFITNMDQYSLRMDNPYYQLRLHDMFNIASRDIVNYFATKGYIATIDDAINAPVDSEFNQMNRKLQIFTDWSKRITKDSYILIQVYRYVDDDEAENVYGDWVFKKLAAAYAKKQYGFNVSKFEGVQLPGGVTMNGSRIVEQAEAEIEKIETEFIMKYQGPDNFYIG